MAVAEQVCVRTEFPPDCGLSALATENCGVIIAGWNSSGLKHSRGAEDKARHSLLGSQYDSKQLGREKTNSINQNNKYGEHSQSLNFINSVQKNPFHWGMVVHIPNLSSCKAKEGERLWFKASLCYIARDLILKNSVLEQQV